MSTSGFSWNSANRSGGIPAESASPVSSAASQEARSSTTLIDAPSKYGAFENRSGPSSMVRR